MKKRRNKPNSPGQPPGTPAPEPAAAAPTPPPPETPSEPTPQAMEEMAAAAVSEPSPPGEAVSAPSAAAPVVPDYRSTPSREDATVSDWWRFTGLLGACLLLASILMWMTNVIALAQKAPELAKARTDFDTAYKAAQAKQLKVVQEGKDPRNDPAVRSAFQTTIAARDHLASLEKQATEWFAWSSITAWAIIGYGLLLLHAVRERHVAVVRTFGLSGLGMLAFGALYLAYILGAESHGIGIGLLAAAAVGLLMLGLFLQPLVSSTAEADEETSRKEFSDLVFKAGLGGLALVLLGVTAYLVHDWLKVYAAQIAQYKEGSTLTFGLMPLGLVWTALGLGLVLVYTAQEREDRWRQAALWPVLALGGIAILGGLGTGLGDWLGAAVAVVPHGLVFTGAGLVLVWAALSRWEEGAFRQRACWALVAVGVAFFLLAAGRSLEAPLREHFQQRYDVAAYMVPHGFLLMVMSALCALTGWGLASDQRFLVMTRRELAALFHSPIAYICLAGLGLVGWLSYVQWLDALTGGRAVPEPIVRIYLFSFYCILAMIIVLPMFTMRLLSEEQRSGTLEVLLTAPVTEAAVVLSKFLGVWLFSLCCFALWLLFPLLLRVYGQEEFDYRPLLSFYLGLGCIFAHFLALGLFCSSITRSQIVAFLLGLAGMLVLLVPFFIAMVKTQVQDASPQEVEAYLYLSFIHHLLELQEGRVHLRHLTLHVTACVFWLFVTTKVLEARKWQ